MKIHIIGSIVAAGVLVGCQSSKDAGYSDYTYQDPAQVGAPTYSSGAPAAPVGTSSASSQTVHVEPQLGTKWNDLPAAVQNTVRMKVPHAIIEDIDMETKTGGTVYEFSFKDENLNPKLHVAADGTIVKSDNEIEATGAPAPETGTTEGGPVVGTTLSDLPQAVRDTINERAPNAIVDDIDKETRSGKVVYEITFKDEGKNPKLHVAEDGTIVEDLTK